MRVAMAANAFDLFLIRWLTYQLILPIQTARYHPGAVPQHELGMFQNPQKMMGQRQ